MTTLPTTTLPTPADLALDPTSPVQVTVSNLTYPEIHFYLRTDLAEVENAITQTVASEVLRVETDKVSHYARAHTDMDVPDSTEATYGLRIYTYNPTTESVEIRFHGLLDVRGVGRVGEVRYRQLHDETKATIDLVLASQPNLRLKLETIVNAAKARVVTNPNRLEEIRTTVINRLVADTTNAAREKAVRNVEKNSTVKVVAGRKVPLGTTGKVIWKGKGAYGWRVGLKPDPNTDEVVWTALTNVNAVYDDAEVTAAALAEAKKIYTEGHLAAIFGAARA